jgi:hypothetical protein
MGIKHQAGVGPGRGRASGAGANDDEDVVRAAKRRSRPQRRGDSQPRCALRRRVSESGVRGVCVCERERVERGVRAREGKASSLPFACRVDYAK